MRGKASNESYNAKTPNSEQYSEQETVARAEATLKRMLATPHKPHSELKVGKRKAKASQKTSRMEYGFEQMERERLKLL